jgi:hypothetical protein
MCCDVNRPTTTSVTPALLAPMYGGGALLIREVTRRAGRGVPTMLLLGVAYGLLEEGIATQSLFNPHYAGADLLHVGYIPWLGIAVPWTLYVLTLHAVGSTTVPIVMAELCTPRRRTAPWLGRPGLGVAAILFVVGVAGHTLAAAAAALLTYAWHAFPETPVVPALPVVDLIGNVIFALGAVLLIGMAWRRTATASTIVSDSAHTR